MEPKKEFKNFNLEIKKVTELGMFEGYASTFGNVDQGLDVVDRGAFKRTLRSSKGKIPILDHHNPSKQIGWNLEAKEDALGLYVKGQLDLNVQAASERHSLMKMAFEVGGRTGLSIGFATLKEEPDGKNPRIRHLKEVKLFEYSVVTFPMNVEASVTGVKFQADRCREFFEFELGLEGEKLDEAVSKIKSLLELDPGSTHSERNGPDISGALGCLKQFNETLKE